MNADNNTLFLRLAGAMQSWGTSSRLQIRRTDACPSKSGVLGMLLCAMGVAREDSHEALARLNTLAMGVRVDRAGEADWDYHTAGARIGIRKAEGGVKRTAKTGRFETLLSRRQYLFDASFLVALRGDCRIVHDGVETLSEPVWPIFLGRKCCIPSEPVFAGCGAFRDLGEALTSIPWRSRIPDIDNPDAASTRTLDAYIEHLPGSPPPAHAQMVHDVPNVLGFHSHGPRHIVHCRFDVPVGDSIHPQSPRRQWVDPYGDHWDQLRQRRLGFDGGLCVFCKSPAVDVHHVDYRGVRLETLRSLCKNCHDACTMLEYAGGTEHRRIDPLDPARRTEILTQVQRLLTQRRLGRRRDLLQAARAVLFEYSGARSQARPLEAT